MKHKFLSILVFVIFAFCSCKGWTDANMVEFDLNISGNASTTFLAWMKHYQLYTILGGIIASAIATVVIGYLKSKICKPHIGIAKQLSILDNTIIVKIRNNNLISNLYDLDIYIHLLRKNEETHMLELCQIEEKNILPHSFPVLSSWIHKDVPSYYLLRFKLNDKCKDLIEDKGFDLLMIQVSAIHGHSNLKLTKVRKYKIKEDLKPYPYRPARSLKLDEEYFIRTEKIRKEHNLLKSVVDLSKFDKPFYSCPDSPEGGSKELPQKPR